MGTVVEFRRERLAGGRINEQRNVHGVLDDGAEKRREARSLLAEAADLLRGGDVGDIHAAWLIEECMSLIGETGDVNEVERKLFQRIAQV